MEQPVEVIMKQSREWYRSFLTAPKDVPAITAGLEELYNKRIIGKKGPGDSVLNLKFCLQDAFAGIAYLAQAKLGACKDHMYSFSNLSEPVLKDIGNVWAMVEKLCPPESLAGRTGVKNNNTHSLRLGS
ncbi:MAG: hypothetical protein WC521_05780 [Bdellovibrionales bacterium]